MRNFYVTRLLVATMLAGMVAQHGVCQNFANASLSSVHPFDSFRSVTNQSFHEDNKVELKEALRDLKKRFHLRFAYREGLLDGKVVSGSLLNYDQATPEEILDVILKNCHLSYKQINRRQYIIISLEDEEALRRARVPAPVQEETVVADSGSTDVSALIEQIYVLPISGKVTAEDDGQPLPGVNIVVKGTSIGTTTDADGNYRLNMPEEGGVLVFSFIGYATKEVVFASQTVINVSMVLELQTLGEVVVTALGIEKDKNSVAYSVTQVDGSEFTQAREVNVANALSGKVAGVNATGLSTGPGGSSRVIIRGNNSLSGNNQPLYVVNGMPIDNSTPGGSPSANGGGLNVDRGDGISGINPDDIESITVLKGGTAAALYGSRASNGVILITTKKGKAQKGIGIEYNSTLTYEAPAVYPDKFQYQYGHGKLGRKPTSQSEAVSWGRHAWGAPMDGQPYVSIDGEMHPYSPVSVKDNLKKFYRTGSTYTNTVAFTGGSEMFNFRFSLSNTDSKGIMRSSSLNKKIASLNLNAYLNEKLTIETVTQFNVEDVKNRTMAGDANGNPNWIYMLANTIDADQLAPGYLEDGNEFVWNETPYATNPYFIVNRYQTRDKKNRFIGQFNIKYEILDNLYVKGTVARDFYDFNYVGIIPTGTNYLSPPGSGEYHAIKSAVSETNSMITMNYNKNIAPDLNVNILGGVNRRTFENDQTSIDGTQFVLPYFYSYTNLVSLTTTPLRESIETNSVFGSVDVDYKGIAFLSVTGRQDWFSTLSIDNNTIFYPSVGASLVLSEALSMPAAVSFAKLRGSWAQVGGGAPDPYAVNLSYSMVQGGHNGRPLQQVSSSIISDPGLKPYTSTNFETGLEAKFLNNRIGFDLALYHQKTTDDIVITDVSLTSGYNQARLNVGELENKGVELLITGTPVKNESFSWDVSYNMAYNKSKVLKLAEGVNTILLASSVGNWAGVYGDVGRPYGTLKGYTMLQDDQGRTIYNASSGYEQRSDLVELGNGVPPLTMGVTNTINYKRLSLSALIDGKFGNKIFSVMDTYATRFGLHSKTLPGRENGELRLEGVDTEGNLYERTIDYESDAYRLYWDNTKNYSVLQTSDGSFVKLRQVVLSYSIPVNSIKFVKIQSASLSFVARNLAILYRKTDNFDPESSHTNSNAQGFESFSLPRTRSYGFNLMVKF